MGLKLLVASDFGGLSRVAVERLLSLALASHSTLAFGQPVLFNNRQAQGNLARNVGWYRKHFALPAEWAGDVVFLYVEGIFHVSQFYLNGVPLAEHDAGYTSFAIRLDNATGLQYGTQVSDENGLGFENAFA